MNAKQRITTTLSRRTFLKSCAAGTAALYTHMMTSNAFCSDSPKRSVLFIYTDDQRFNTIHALGCSEIITPNMDRLVKRGTAFTHAMTMGGVHGALCIPSRVMALTGRTLFHLNRDGSQVPPEHITLPEMLRHKGYSTFISGKWHSDAPSLIRSFESGEAVFLGGMTDHFKAEVSDIENGEMVRKRTETRFDGEVFTDATIRFINRTPADKPFFAYLPLTTPHDPRKVPDEYHKLYDPEKIPLPPNFMPKHPFNNGELDVRDELLAGFPRTEKEVRQHIAEYYASITAADAQIGRVLDALKKAGRLDDTIIVFAGDNGLAVGQHGLMGKQSIYDHSIRVPLVFSGPGIHQDKKSDELCYVSDITPTICGLLGINPPATSEGMNLQPVICQGKRNIRDAAVLVYRNMHHAVRTHDYKLIEYLVDGKRTTQLFDMKADPWEMKNLADDPGHTVVLKKLRERLAQLEKENDVPALGQPLWK